MSSCGASLAVTKARSIFGLYAAVAVAGLATIVLVLVTAMRALTFTPPDAGELLSACRSFVLPDVGAASLLVLALGSLGVAVVVLAVRAAARELRRQRRFLGALRVITTGSVSGTTVFTDARPFAFCAGLLRPRSYISTGALEALEPDELHAVLAHEAHHARSYDPLRVFAARVLADALFFLPALRRLADRYGALAELSADAAAVRASAGERQPLASALLAFGETADPAVVSIAPERVDHLMGRRTRWGLPLTALSWAVLALGGLVALAIRAAEVTEAGALNVPLVAAQACMVLMVVVPVLIGAAAIVGSRRLGLRRART